MIQWIHTHMITLNISTLDCHTPQHIHKDPNWSQSVKKLSSPYDSTVYSTNPHSFFFFFLVSYIYLFLFQTQSWPLCSSSTSLHCNHHSSSHPLSHLSFSTLFPTKVFWKITKFLNPNYKLVQ